MSGIAITNEYLIIPFAKKLQASSQPPSGQFVQITVHQIDACVDDDVYQWVCCCEDDAI